MKDFEYTIDNIGKGLRPSSHNPRNSPFLVESIGAFPYDGVLQSVAQLLRVDTSALICSFPYPQIFVLSDYIIVCTQTAIVELTDIGVIDGWGDAPWGEFPWGSTLLTGLTAGWPWVCVDFKLFIYLTNGKIAIIRDTETGAWTINPENIPFGTALCNYNGQVLVGSPNKAVS